MRYALSLICILLVFSSASAQTAPAGWKLVWGDEFDYKGLPDPSRWTYETGYVRNNEAQEYMKERLENARVEGGMLVIEAHREQRAKGNFTSASITSEGKKDILYGRVEVRAKIPTGKGTWPAIWMLGTNRRQVGWPACGEIDILENVGYDPDKIHANIHTAAFNHSKKTNKGNTITVEKPWEDFHIYAIEWSKDRIDFFYDDQKYFSYENSGKGVEEWPYSLPHYLILNLAIGGAWGGQQGIDESSYPKQFLIDYVRLFEKQ